MDIQKALTKNLSLKVISLLLAIMIWFAIYAFQHDIRFGKSLMEQTRSFPNHPITVMKTAADVNSYRVVPSDVDVVLRGPPQIMESLTEHDIEVYINLTDVVDAEKIEKKVIVIPPENVKVVDIKPSVVRIEKIK
ncbi:MAG: CdaR family protein [Verrucomicrobiae bacterium]|nr:CdaR family protein [Verrucomicrobiae bacterium]